MRIIAMLFMQMKIEFAISTIPLLFHFCKFSHRLYNFFQHCTYGLKFNKKTQNQFCYRSEKMTSTCENYIKKTNHCLRKKKLENLDNLLTRLNLPDVIRKSTITDSIVRKYIQKLKYEMCSSEL